MTRIVTLTLNPAIDSSTSIRKLEPFSKLRCAAPKLDPGGGGINVARVAHRLGGDALAIYPEGGASGHLLRGLVEREGVPSLTVQTQGETRQNFTVFEEEGERQYRFLLPGAPLEPNELERCLGLLAALPAAPAWLAASGSLPPGAPPETFAQAARMAKQRGAKVAVDSSGAPLREALKEGVALIKPNLREFRELTGTGGEGEAQLVAAARDLIDRFNVETVALTLGDRGALAVSRAEAVRADALPIRPESVVGAGDSFLGAMIWCLANGGGLAEALRYGVAAGSAALLHAGTELCRRDDVIALAPKVKIEALSAAG